MTTINQLDILYTTNLNVLGYTLKKNDMQLMPCNLGNQISK